MTQSLGNNAGLKDKCLYPIEIFIFPRITPQKKAFTFYFLLEVYPCTPRSTELSTTNSLAGAQEAPVSRRLLTWNTFALTANTTAVATRQSHTGYFSPGKMQSEMLYFF